MSNIIEKYIGQNVAIAVDADRYFYRGILSKVDETFLVLDCASVVLETGLYYNKKRTIPAKEEFVGDMIVSINKISMIYQPSWSQGQLPVE